MSSKPVGPQELLEIFLTEHRNALKELRPAHTIAITVAERDALLEYNRAMFKVRKDFAATSVDRIYSVPVQVIQ